MKKIYTIILVIAAFVTSKTYSQCNPATPSIVNVIDDSVTIAWTAVTGALGYEYAVLPATAPQPPSGTSTTALGFGMNNLQYQPYKVWLRSDCGSSVFSNWSSVTFTVACGSPAVTLTVLHDTSADFSWNAISGTATYEYVIDQTPGDPTVAGTSLTGTQFHVGGLYGGISYYIHLRTKCNTTAFSSWTNYAFTTPFPTGINKETRNGISIYPNPVNDQLNIELTDNKGSISIVNVMGIMVYTAPVTANKFVLDMIGYPSGLYALRFYNGTTIQTIKIQKL